jgi:hypothetical protein
MIKPQNRTDEGTTEVIETQGRPRAGYGKRLGATTPYG